MKIGTKSDSIERYYEFLCELYHNGASNLYNLAKEYGIATAAGTVVRGLNLVDGKRGQNFWIADEEPTWHLASFVQETTMKYANA